MFEVEFCYIPDWLGTYSVAQEGLESMGSLLLP